MKKVLRWKHMFNTLFNGKSTEVETHFNTLFNGKSTELETHL